MIALIDCNNFYCSCERVFQPTLIGRALIVLSNNDGCAIARSDEAKELGIEMAQPAFMIEQVIRENNVAVYSSNYTLYDNMSSRVMQVIRELVPKTEVYSIDEIFADLTGMKYHDLSELAKTIRQTVKRCTGIPVSVGIAPTKALAKMANRYAKKTRPDEGVFVARTPELVDLLLKSTAIGQVWGIGKELEKVLKNKGFTTAYEFAKKAPEKWIRKEMSVVGQRLYKELNGISCLRWEEERPARKKICTSRSFGNLVTQKADLKQAIAKFTSSCGEKLRREKTCASKIHIFIQTNPHRPTDEQYFESITLQLQVPTNLTTELMKYSMRGFEMIFRPGYKFQKAGVEVSNLVPEAQTQLGLFEPAPKQQDKRLMQSLDTINAAFGRDVVRFGSQDYGKNWHLKHRNLSSAYTTRLEDIPKAK